MASKQQAAKKTTKAPAKKSGAKGKGATKTTSASAKAPVAAKASIKAPGKAPGNASFPGRLEIATAKGAVIEALPLREPLLAETRFAALLDAAELRAHLYVAHKQLRTEVVTALAYVKTEDLGGKSAATLRVPQRGAWLWCPGDGAIFVVASAVPLDGATLTKLLDGRAPPPVKGDDTNMAK